MTKMLTQRIGENTFKKATVWGKDYIKGGNESQLAMY